MGEAFPRSGEDHVKNIATLSEKLAIPVHEVRVIYQSTFDQLAAAARIPTYLSVLAMNGTRSILRRRAGHEAPR